MPDLRPVNPEGAKACLKVFLAQFGFLALTPIKPADEALGDDLLHSRSDQKRLNVHIHQSCDRSGRIICVDGAQNHVTRQRGPDCNLGGLTVTDFPNHDHVRILAEDVTESRCEIEADLGLDLGLVDTFHLIFDRILNCQNPALGRVNGANKCVKRGGLSGPGGTGDQHNPVGPRQHLSHPFVIIIQQADLTQRQGFLPLVQQTQAHTLAIHGGKGRDTDVDVIATDLVVDTAILRAPFFRNIQARHDFQA
ncbi:MAG: hypothetical protein BWY82_01653 [Verrucomicrobia bacterium ADurb.Bin474]|nr:MAG: hypothetical protein BWY82_01653 [Verrucomicrobia bacterium ADurb.Bin474]